MEGAFNSGHEYHVLQGDEGLFGPYEYINAVWILTSQVD